MEHIFEEKVFYSDTDAYGVVWHGAYLRWLEMGRCLWCDEMGYSLLELSNQDIVLPVINLNIKYKSSAKLEDKLVILTKVEKYNQLSVTFKQIIKSKETNKTFVEATVDVVAVHNDGKLYRRMPELLTKLFKKSITEQSKTI